MAELDTRFGDQDAVATDRKRLAERGRCARGRAARAARPMRLWLNALFTRARPWRTASSDPSPTSSYVRQGWIVTGVPTGSRFISNRSVAARTCTHPAEIGVPIVRPSPPWIASR